MRFCATVHGKCWVGRKRSNSGVLDKSIKVRSPWIIGEAFFPEPRRERGDVAGRMIIDPLQDVNQVGVRIHVM